TTSLEAARANRFAGSKRFAVCREPKGIIPNDGKPEIACACSGVRTVLSKASRRKARPRPELSPRARAKVRFRGMFGEEGWVGIRAWSTLRIFVERKPAVTPASFSFCRRPSYRV